MSERASERARFVAAHSAPGIRQNRVRSFVAVRNPLPFDKYAKSRSFALLAFHLYSTSIIRSAFNICILVIVLWGGKISITYFPWNLTFYFFFFLNISADLRKFIRKRWERGSQSVSKVRESQLIARVIAIHHAPKPWRRIEKRDVRSCRARQRNKQEIQRPSFFSTACLRHDERKLETRTRCLWRKWFAVSVGHSASKATALLRPTVTLV